MINLIVVVKTVEIGGRSQILFVLCSQMSSENEIPGLSVSQGVEAWGPSKKSLLSKLQAFNNRCTKTLSANAVLS